MLTPSDCKHNGIRKLEIEFDERLAELVSLKVSISWFKFDVTENQEISLKGVTGYVWGLN